MASNQGIELRAEDEYALSARGCDYTLKLENGRWAMYVVNATVRAWNRGFAQPKYFDDLAAVEAKYKAWAGIEILATARTQPGFAEKNLGNTH
jgi:hypothetical protein